MKLKSSYQLVSVRRVLRSVAIGVEKVLNKIGVEITI